MAYNQRLGHLYGDDSILAYDEAWDHAEPSELIDEADVSVGSTLTRLLFVSGSVLAFVALILSPHYL